MSGDSEGEAWLVTQGSLLCHRRGHSAAWEAPQEPEPTCKPAGLRLASSFSELCRGTSVRPPRNDRPPSLFLGMSLLIGNAKWPLQHIFHRETISDWFKSNHDDAFNWTDRRSLPLVTTANNTMEETSN